MGDFKKNIIDRINYVSGYVINETPKYRPLIDDSSFDSAPEGWNMKEAEGDPTAPEAGSPESLLPATPVAPTSGATDPTAATPAAATPPAPAAPETPSIAPELPAVSPTPLDTQAGDTQGGDPTIGSSFGLDGPTKPTTQDTDQLQNELMRFQLDAMKKMSQKIDQLEGVIDSLNAQQAQLYKEVDNVRDPSDVEKFANRKDDSSPYYFNLNDMWNGNTFQARMDNFNSKGIVKTNDGFVADFDQLPKMTSYQLKDSFEQI